MCALTGHSREELVGTPCKRYFTDPRRAEDGIRTVLAEDRLTNYELTVRSRSGRETVVSCNATTFRSADGRLRGVFASARDITAQKQGNRADLLLASIVSSSDDAIISKSLEGIITSWNEGARRIFGYGPEEIIGQTVLKLIPADRRDEEPKILERLRRGDRVDHFETVRLRKNGESFPVSLTISPIRNLQGVIVGASKIARDITDLKTTSAEREQLLESERTARSQAEYANRMKDEFLSTISHELRTPLNAIVGWTEVLEGGGQSREEVIQGVEVIKRNAMMQAQLIEDLLDLGRISSGKMTLNVEPVDIGAVIREALASVEHGARAKQITITRVLGESRGLLGDAKRLQQVIWNLLTNAIKFTPNGGKIVISAARINSHIEVSVADSGQGIAADFLPHLFERFRQADSSTTRPHGGLGIGLALVKQLVELHGGTVRAESPGAGMGSVFTLFLPVAALRSEMPRALPGRESAAAVVLPDLQGIKILAVDDDADSLEPIRRILTGRNADVQTASSVDDAMVKFAEFAPDVVLSDLGMPGKDGYELIRLIRHHPAGANTPAAALTALARSEDRTRALTAGFQSHVTKPVAAAEIVALVRSLASLRPASRRPE